MGSNDRRDTPQLGAAPKAGNAFQTFIQTIMSYIRQIFESHPIDPSSNHDVDIECIAACFACSEACNVCADACLAESNLAELVGCIRNNLDCADICLATARVISRLTATNKEMAGSLLRACADACRICGAECSRHGEKMVHCKICAEACQRCAAACESLLSQ